MCHITQYLSSLFNFLGDLDIIVSRSRIWCLFSSSTEKVCLTLSSPTKSVKYSHSNGLIRSGKKVSMLHLWLQLVANGGLSCPKIQGIQVRYFILESANTLPHTLTHMLTLTHSHSHSHTLNHTHTCLLTHFILVSFWRNRVCCRSLICSDY